MGLIWGEHVISLVVLRLLTQWGGFRTPLLENREKERVFGGMVEVCLIGLKFGGVSAGIKTRQLSGLRHRQPHMILETCA